MKKQILTTLVAGTMIFSMFAGQASATTGNKTPVPTAKLTATATPMLDNLFKYGLKKDIELPATVTAGGFSYTLEKIMIYETKSTTAQALIKQYGFTGTEGEKYFIWTKFTIANNSGNLVQQNAKDLAEKWRLNFGEEAYVKMPDKLWDKTNSPLALWNWKLAPGQKLSSYQAYSYSGDFNWFYVSLKVKNTKAYLEVVKE